MCETRSLQTRTYVRGQARTNRTESFSSLLARTRNLLLPKLMSGEIRLAEAEKVVESVG